MGSIKAYEHKNKKYSPYTDCITITGISNITDNQTGSASFLDTESQSKPILVTVVTTLCPCSFISSLYNTDNRAAELHKAMTIYIGNKVDLSPPLR